MTNTRRIRFDGADSDFMYFSTPSWSRFDVRIRHELHVDKRDGRIGCSCEDAAYRKRFGNLVPTGNENPCKHATKLAQTCQRIISEGLTQAIAA